MSIWPQVAASLRTARETLLELARATGADPVAAGHFQGAQEDGWELVIVTMSSGDVVEVLDRLNGTQIESVARRGWGVDALMREQTRAHHDLDLIVRLTDVPALREVLARDDFPLVEGAPDSNFVIRNLRGREIDVHNGSS